MLFVAWFAALNRLHTSARDAVALTLGWIVFTLPIQWLQFALVRAASARAPRRARMNNFNSREFL